MLQLGKSYQLSKSEYYLIERNILIDYRGEVNIHPTAEISFNVKIYTASHPADWLLHDERLAEMKRGKVEIGARSWICSEVVLYNCIIGEDCVIGVGSVVSNVEIPDGSMVMGNPGQVVAKWVDGKWVRLSNG